MALYVAVCYSYTLKNTVPQRPHHVALTLTQSCSKTSGGTCSGEHDTLYTNRANLAKMRELTAQSTGKLATQPDSSTDERVAGSSANLSRAQQNA